MTTELLFETYVNELYEGVNFDSFKEVFKRTELQLLNNFIALGTFGSLITLFYPIVNNLISNSILKVDVTPTNVVLATVGAFSILIDKDRDKLGWIYKHLKETSWRKVIKELVSAFKNIVNIFKLVAKEFGKVIGGFADMAAYLLLTAPFLKALLDYIQLNKLNSNDFEGMALSIGGGIVLIGGKNVVEVLIKDIKKKNSNLEIGRNMSENLNEKFNWTGLSVWVTLIGMIVLSGMFHEVRDWVTKTPINLWVEQFLVLFAFAYRNEIMGFMRSHKTAIKDELGERIDEVETFEKKSLNEGLFSFITTVWNKLKRLNILMNGTMYGIYKKIESNNNIRGYVGQIISSNSSYQREGFYSMIAREIDNILTEEEKKEFMKLKQYSLFR